MSITCYYKNMARPQKCRKVCFEPEYCNFLPDGFPVKETVTLTIDEYEVIRLIDLLDFDQNECAKQIEVSRTTVTQMYDNARKKIADSLVNGKPLKIEGGNYCLKPIKKNKKIIPKGENIMRIAVTFENDSVFQHFGHTEFFKIYDVQDKNIIQSQVVSTNGQGHGALAGFLKSNNVDTLICGGIGGGAQTALKDVGIKFYGGVTGNADDAVKSLLEEKLNYNPTIKCNHHASGAHHGNGEHSCSSHSCSK